MKIAAVIMCSGLSKRMGKNKLLMNFNGRRMFEYVIDTVTQVDFAKIAIVTTYCEIGKYAEELEVYYNPNSNEGISASIKIGIQSCRDCDGIMFFTADQPFLNAETIIKLLDAFRLTNKIVVPIAEGTPKNPVIFPFRYYDELMLLRGEQGGKKVYNNHLDDICFINFQTINPFIDIDTLSEFYKYNK